MNKDDCGDVVNGVDTYETIAECLNSGQPVFIGWTDGDGLHYDILFTFKCFKMGVTQGGVRWSDLFVSVMRSGSFGFNIVNRETHGNYYAEKLGIQGDCTTSEKLAELINNVKAKLKVA